MERLLPGKTNLAEKICMKQVLYKISGKRIMFFDPLSSHLRSISFWRLKNLGKPDLHKRLGIFEAWKTCLRERKDRYVVVDGVEVTINLQEGYKLFVIKNESLL